MIRLSKSAVLICCVALFAKTALGAKHETWVEVRSPHFIVVSNAGEKEARQTAVRFEQIRTLFRQMITIAANAPSPTITIFAVKNEGSLRDLLPEYWVKGHSHPAGIFFSRLNQFYAAVQLDAEGDNPYETLYHEYYHSLTLPYFPGLPLWLAEGFAEFFGNTQINDKEAFSGQPSPGLIEELRENRLIPLDVLFNVDRSSPYYNEQNKTSEFYAESWALVHYFMIGDNGVHRQLLATYLDALSHGAAGPEAAAKAFGDLGNMQKTLQKYIGNYEFYHLTAAAPPKIPDSDLQARPLPDAEVDAEMGGFAATRGHIQDAEPLLQNAIRLEPNLALARQNLALAEFFDGQMKEALDAASQAVALDPKNGLTRYLRAYLTVTGGGMTARDPQVEDDLRQSIAANPDFAPPYALLGIYLAADERSLPEALSSVQKAISLEPGTAGFQADLAQVLARMRRYDDARTAALRARADAILPQERAQADQVIAMVERMRSFDGNSRSGESPVPADLPPLRHRTETQDAPESEPANPAPAGPQTAQEVTGVVTKISCNPAMRLQVAASDGTYDLYTVPGEQTRFEAPSQPPAGFNPCSSLKGVRVTVQYDADDAKAQKGKIEVLKILGWEKE